VLLSKTYGSDGALAAQNAHTEKETGARWPSAVVPFYGLGNVP
jgi:hypothetical protein